MKNVQEIHAFYRTHSVNLPCFLGKGNKEVHCFPNEIIQAPAAAFPQRRHTNNGNTLNFLRKNVFYKKLRLKLAEN